MTARALLLWALDDRSDHAEGFATSLFTSTQDEHEGFARTDRLSRGTANAAKPPLTERIH